MDAKDLHEAHRLLVKDLSEFIRSRVNAFEVDTCMNVNGIDVLFHDDRQIGVPQHSFIYDVNVSVSL